MQKSRDDDAEIISCSVCRCEKASPSLYIFDSNTYRPRASEITHPKPPSWKIARCADRLLAAHTNSWVVATRSV